MKTKIYEIYDSATGALLLRDGVVRCSEYLSISTRWFRSCVACGDMVRNRYKVIRRDEEVRKKDMIYNTTEGIENTFSKAISPSQIRDIKAKCSEGTELEIFRSTRNSACDLPFGVTEKCWITGMYNYIFTVNSESGNYRSFTWAELATGDGIKLASN